MKFGIPNKDPWEAYHQNQQGNPGIPILQTGDPDTPVPGIADDTVLRSNPAGAEYAGDSHADPGFASGHSLDQD